MKTEGRMRGYRIYRHGVKKNPFQPYSIMMRSLRISTRTRGGGAELMKGGLVKKGGKVDKKLVIATLLRPKFSAERYGACNRN